MSRLFCFGLGYSAAVLARRLALQSWSITGTATNSGKAEALRRIGYEMFVFDGMTPNGAIGDALKSSSHVLLSIPPDANGDPALRHYGDAIAASPSVKWIGYFSSVAVYGDSGGAWVDEESPPQPRSERGRRRLDAEHTWREVAEQGGKALVLFRLPGIYGPGRSAIDQLRAGTARRIAKPGQVTNRVHVEDIATAVEAALRFSNGARVYNVTDDMPAPPQDVTAYGAKLLGVPCPPASDLDDAKVSPMARSFYAENKKVSNARMKAELGVTLAYPTYVEGLKSIAGTDTPAF